MTSCYNQKQMSQLNNENRQSKTRNNGKTLRRSERSTFFFINHDENRPTATVTLASTIMNESAKTTSTSICKERHFFSFKIYILNISVKFPAQTILYSIPMKDEKTPAKPKLNWQQLKTKVLHIIKRLNRPMTIAGRIIAGRRKRPEFWPTKATPINDTFQHQHQLQISRSHLISVKITLWIPTEEWKSSCTPQKTAPTAKRLASVSKTFNTETKAFLRKSLFLY